MERVQWNHKSTELERIRNGYQTDKGTEIERICNAFRSVFPVRLILSGTVVAFEKKENLLKGV